MINKSRYQTTQFRGTQGVWTSIAPDAAIKIWASDLSRLVRESSSIDDWFISGQGVMIEATEAADVRDLMHHLAGEAQMQLHVLDANSVVQNFPQWFEALEPNAPALVFLGEGGWQGGKFAEKHPNAPHFPFDEDQCRQFRADLASLMAEKLPGKPVVLVTAVASVDQMDVSLRHADVFGRRIQMPQIPDEALASAFIEEVGYDICGLTILNQARKVACLLRNEYPDRRRRQLMQKAMKRLAWREQRLLAFDDMVRFASYGTCDADSTVQDDRQKYRTAVHEAGHAVVSHLTSRHQTAPEYCSIVPRDEISGIVVSAFDGHERNSDDPTWVDMNYQVRVRLAGRAAEHLLLGAEEVSAKGASSDLEIATDMVGAMFGRWGLSDDHSSDSLAGSNLAVVLGDPSISESAYLEEKVRKFLQKKFEETLAILRQHRLYLESLVQALIKRKVLLQEDLLAVHASLQAARDAP